MNVSVVRDESMRATYLRGNERGDHDCWVWGSMGWVIVPSSQGEGELDRKFEVEEHGPSRSRSQSSQWTSNDRSSSNIVHTARERASIATSHIATPTHHPPCRPSTDSQPRRCAPLRARRCRSARPPSSATRPPFTTLAWLLVARRAVLLLRWRTPSLLPGMASPR